MNRFKEIAFYVGIAFLPMYLITWFILMEFNPAAWPMDVRVVYILFSIVITYFTLIYQAAIKQEEGARND